MMRSFPKARALALCGSLLFAPLLAMSGARAGALSEVVFNFAGAPANPICELVAGPDGTLFGTTSTGGGMGFGTIFKLGADGLPETVLEFSGNGGTNRGAAPAAGLVLASDGNF